MSETYKTCPICGAANGRGANICTNCGTSLDDKSDQSAAPRTASKGPQYDFRYGETDLLEDNLKRVGQYYLLGLMITLLLIMAGGLLLAFRPVIFSGGDGGGTGGELPIASTARSTLSLPTVTSGPPTLTPSPTPSPMPSPTLTPTREPCLIRVEPNDGLYTIVQRCGHRLENLDIIDVVLSLNNIDNPQLIRQGQIIEVPWPTETPDPASLPTETPEEVGSSGAEVASASEISAFDEAFDPSFFPTATLQPGIAIHNVARDENIIVIAVAYGANVEILSQLNPEISFSQCDFGQTFGGPRCTVQIFEGQQIRVPAPTGTPTLPPTPSGSETPTPTPTATFNAPSAISPSNRAFFRRDELVTLRWGASGTLSDDQTYRVRVENVTDGIVYAADTINNSFTLPAVWQGASNQRYEFIWQVSVIDLNNPDNPYFTTTPRTFFWEGRR